MSLANDPEGQRIAISFAGEAFDKPRTITHEMFAEYSFEYARQEFLSVISAALEKIPPQYRDQATVELERSWCDEPSRFVISYVGPESAEVVTERISRCEQYVTERRASERATYEKLKVKFGQ